MKAKIWEPALAGERKLSSPAKAGSQIDTHSLPTLESVGYDSCEGFAAGMMLLLPATMPPTCPSLI
jgi:hypothetical protein